MKKIILLIVFSLFASPVLFSQDFQYRSKYPDIPIVDVHSHASEVRDAVNLIKVSETIRQKYGSNLAFWIGLSTVANPAEMKIAANNRMLFAVAGPEGEFAIKPRPRNAYEGVGIEPYAEEVIRKVHNDGYVGLKIWFGPHGRGKDTGQVVIANIDDHRFAQFFSRLEEENILMTSLHIADPNGPFDKRQTDKYLRIWTLRDPVWFWKQIRAFENVVAKHPNLIIVVAHAAFLLSQDAQVDYLRYMLSTYSNLYVDIAATSFYLHYSNHDNLVNFFTEYQDRILFGLDAGTVRDSDIKKTVDWYAELFAFLETDQIVNIGFYHNVPAKGLNLPKETLEKIYYKNALKLYPGLKEAMNK